MNPFSGSVMQDKTKYDGLLHWCVDTDRAADDSLTCRVSGRKFTGLAYTVGVGFYVPAGGLISADGDVAAALAARKTLVWATWRRTVAYGTPGNAGINFGVEDDTRSAIALGTTQLNGADPDYFQYVGLTTNDLVEFTTAAPAQTDFGGNSQDGCTIMCVDWTAANTNSRMVAVCAPDATHDTYLVSSEASNAANLFYKPAAPAAGTRYLNATGASVSVAGKNLGGQLIIWSSATNPTKIKQFGMLEFDARLPVPAFAEMRRAAIWMAHPNNARKICPLFAGYPLVLI